MSVHALLRFGHVLAVVAHPDDESFGLGGIIAALVASGARVDVLCFTHGEASTLGRTAGPDLAAQRARELSAAGEVLGVERTELLDLPDGRLADRPVVELAVPIAALVRETGPDALLALDDTGVTGHQDHRRVTAAARTVAEANVIPLYGWAIRDDVAAELNAEFGTSFAGHPRAELPYPITVDRAVQRQAIVCHASQSTDNPVLWRRLELSGTVDHLRRL